MKNAVARLPPVRYVVGLYSGVQVWFNALQHFYVALQQ